MADATPEDFARYKAERADAVAQDAQKLATQKLTKWEPIADRLIELRSWDLKKGSPEYQEFVGLIAEAYMDASRSGLELDDGRPAPKPSAPVVIAAQRLENDKAAAGETITELFEHYARIRVAEGRKRLDGIAQDRMAVHRFAESVGPSKSVGWGLYTCVTQIMKNPAPWQGLSIISCRGVSFHLRSVAQGQLRAA